MSDLDFDISEMYIIVQFKDDESYWVTPFTKVEGYKEWVYQWASDGFVSTMACQTCLVFNDEDDIPVDFSENPLGCSNEPQHCFREAVVAYGPRENLCCTLRALITRAMVYQKKFFGSSRANAILNATQHLRDSSLGPGNPEDHPDSDETYYEPPNCTKHTKQNENDDGFNHSQVW